MTCCPRDEARALFARVAGEERVAAEPAATDEVLPACAGLPLAIRIAGARLATREAAGAVRTLADRLSDERRRLDELRVGNLAVRASFEVSFASLPGPAAAGGLDPARAFRLLGLWTGPSIGLPAAAGLARRAGGRRRATPWTRSWTRTCWSHRRRTGTASTTCCASMRPTAPAPRRRRGDRGEAVTRVLTWYLHTAEAAARVISPQHTQVPLDPVPPALVRPLAFATLEEALAWCEHGAGRADGRHPAGRGLGPA